MPEAGAMRRELQGNGAKKKKKATKKKKAY